MSKHPNLSRIGLAPKELALVVSVALLAGCAGRGNEQSPAPRAAGAASTAALQTNTAPAEAPPQPPPRPGAKEILGKAASQPAAQWPGEGWKRMWTGSLEGWGITQFAGRGEVESESGILLLNMGDPFTGVNWTNPFPKMNYEIALEAMRVMGTDFFCGLTVPVGDTCCSLIVGGWGGGLLGVSSIDGMDASENETTKFMQFQTGKWYPLRLRVTEGRIEGWLGEEKVVDLETADRKITVRPGDIELSKPIGIAAWQTTSAIRNVQYREVDQPADPKRKRRTTD